MTEKDADQSDERATEVRGHLANERTLLSWVRTGLGPISLGIVVERAGALVSQRIAWGISELLGLALAVLGCVTLILGTQQFLRNRRQIIRGEFFPSVGIYLVVAGAWPWEDASSSTSSFSQDNGDAGVPSCDPPRSYLWNPRTSLAFHERPRRVFSELCI
jgi:inner membrane protein YidH